MHNRKDRGRKQPVDDFESGNQPDEIIEDHMNR